MTMVFCVNIVLAILNRSQRSFLVEQHLRCSSEVGDFVMSQLISFPEMGKKKKKKQEGTTDHNRSCDTTVPPCMWTRDDYSIFFLY